MKTYTERELEIAFCSGLLNQEGLTVDGLSDQFRHHKWPLVKKFIDSLKDREDSNTWHDAVTLYNEQGIGAVQDRFIIERIKPINP